MYNQGLILRVNLSDEKISKEPVPKDLRRLYLGGEGINTRLLWDHFLSVDPKIDPLSPDNALIVGMGPLGGTGFGAGSRMKFTYKSPAYNMFGDTNCGSALGAQLRWSGYDHVIITGKAKHPVYLWINDDSVELRDASHLWGKDVQKTDDSIKEELGEDRAETACIGQAGENLVRVASIIAGRNRAGARGGGGCVFGSKNLKAIVGAGTKGVGIYDPAAFFEAMTAFRKAHTTGAAFTEREKRMRYGTISSTRRNHDNRLYNTYRNGQGRKQPDEAVDKLDHIWYTNNIAARAMSCSPGCAFACSGWYHLKGHESPAAKRYAGEWHKKPEYGAANPFGAACDIRDFPAVAHLSKMCDYFGMDTMEIGMTIAFLMELWDRGIITEADTFEWAGESLPLEWGNYRSAEQVIEAIGLQKNKLGVLLQGGVYQAALRLGEIKGVDVLKYAIYGKGGATHEGPVKNWPHLSIACALSPVGAHHSKGYGINTETSMMYLGKPEAGETLSTTLKGSGYAISNNLFAIPNCLGLCFFLSGKEPDIVPLELLAKAFEAVTGTKQTAADLLTVGERVTNLQKAFNSRLGFRREDDTLCHRLMNEPQLAGVAKGMKASNYLEMSKDEYYQIRGWDKKTSLQTRKKLEELDMTDVANVLEKEGALA